MWVLLMSFAVSMYHVLEFLWGCLSARLPSGAPVVLTPHAYCIDVIYRTLKQDLKMLSCCVPDLTQLGLGATMT